MPTPTILLALVVVVISVVELVRSWRQPIMWVWVCFILLALIFLLAPLRAALA